MPKRHRGEQKSSDGKHLYTHACTLNDRIHLSIILQNGKNLSRDLEQRLLPACRTQFLARREIESAVIKEISRACGTVTALDIFTSFGATGIHSSLGTDARRKLRTDAKHRDSVINLLLRFTHESPLECYSQPALDNQKDPTGNQVILQCSSGDGHNEVRAENQRLGNAIFLLAEQVLSFGCLFRFHSAMSTT